MKQLELSAAELYFLAWQMRKLNQEHDNKYAKSIYNKALILFDDKNISLEYQVKNLQENTNVNGGHQKLKVLFQLIGWQMMNTINCLKKVIRN